MRLRIVQGGVATIVKTAEIQAIAFLRQVQHAEINDKVGKRDARGGVLLNRMLKSFDHGDAAEVDVSLVHANALDKLGHGPKYEDGRCAAPMLAGRARVQVPRLEQRAIAVCHHNRIDRCHLLIHKVPNVTVMQSEDIVPRGCRNALLPGARAKCKKRSPCSLSVRHSRDSVYATFQQIRLPTGTSGSRVR